MRIDHSTLRDADVQDYACGLLHEHLHLGDYSKTCPAAALYAVLLYAAAYRITIHAACQELYEVPCDQTVYDALAELLPAQDQLLRRLNAALAATLPRSVRKGKATRRYPVAIDLQLIPYYGRPHASEDELYQGQRGPGTNTYHAYATAYLCYRGRRYTLAILGVHDSQPWQDIVRTLLRLVKKVIGGFRMVLLDRGFWSVAVIRYLYRARYPFIMPVIGRGRRPNHPRGPSATNVFFTWRRSGTAQYTLTEHRGKETASVTIAVKVVRWRRPRQGQQRHGLRALVFAVWGVSAASAAALLHVQQTYRKRFGIETSYRQSNQGRAWTTSRCPLRRLLLFGLALLLRNVWVYVHLMVLAQRRRGHPRLRLHLLRFQTLLRWLAHVIERRCGVRDHIDLQTLSPL